MAKKNSSTAQTENDLQKGDGDGLVSNAAGQENESAAEKAVDGSEIGEQTASVSAALGEEDQASADQPESGEEVADDAASLSTDDETEQAEVGRPDESMQFPERKFVSEEGHRPQSSAANRVYVAGVGFIEVSHPLKK